MTIQELRAKIEQAGGTLLIASDVTAVINDGDVDFKGPNGVFAYIGKGHEDDADVVDATSVFSPQLRYTQQMIALAQYFGIQLDGYEPITVEKAIGVPQVVEGPEQHRLKGMVDAYEKLIVGREVRVSK